MNLQKSLAASNDHRLVKTKSKLKKTNNIRTIPHSITCFQTLTIWNYRLTPSISLELFLFPPSPLFLLPFLMFLLSSAHPLIEITGCPIFTIFILFTFLLVLFLFLLYAYHCNTKSYNIICHQNNMYKLCLFLFWWKHCKCSMNT